MTLVRCLFAPLFCVMFCGPATAGGTDGHTSELFNGRNLQGWVGTGCQAEVEDGLLVLKEGNGFVRTEHRYADFVLELQWRARGKDKWDSGIYFRYQEVPAGAPWPPRYQVNLRHDMMGDLVGFQDGKNEVPTKLGEWNKFVLKVVGGTAALTANGNPRAKPHIEPSFRKGWEVPAV